MTAQREFINRAQYFINILGVLVVSFVVNIEIGPLLRDIIMQIIVSIFIACIHLILKLHFGVKNIVCEHELCEVKICLKQMNKAMKFCIRQTQSSKRWVTPQIGINEADEERLLQISTNQHQLDAEKNV